MASIVRYLSEMPYILYGEKYPKSSYNYSCFDIFILSCVLFLQRCLQLCLQDKPMGAVSVFMTGNYLPTIRNVLDIVGIAK